MKIHIRSLDPTDTNHCLRLFQETVHRINIRDYSRKQLDAWAPTEMDQETWSSRFENRIAYVALERQKIVGFTDMTHEGHLDRLFTAASCQRSGIGRLLVERLIQDARRHAIRRITTEASITAKAFFLSMGFTVTEEQSVECRGVLLTNFAMQKLIAN